jgi:hypothetical protein
MEVHNGLIKGLVDTSMSMSVMIAIIVQKLGIMHLVFEIKSYKTTFTIVTIALGSITNLHVKVGNI